MQQQRIVSIMMGLIVIVVGLVLESTILLQAASVSSNSNIGSFSDAQSQNDLIGKNLRLRQTYRGYEHGRHQ